MRVDLERVWRVARRGQNPIFCPRKLLKSNRRSFGSAYPIIALRLWGPKRAPLRMTPRRWCLGSRCSHEAATDDVEGESGGPFADALAIAAEGAVDGVGALRVRDGDVDEADGFGI